MSKIQITFACLPSQVRITYSASHFNSVAIKSIVRENRGFFLKFGKCDLTDFDETFHIQSTLRINNFSEIIDFLAKRLPW